MQSTNEMVEKSIKLIREMYQRLELNLWFSEDLESDIARFRAMPDEEFMVVATSTSSDALPVLVHEKAKSYLLDVIEARKKNSSNPIHCFYVHPSRGRVEEVTVDFAVAWSKTNALRYKREGVFLKDARGDTTMGYLRVRKEVNQMAGGQVTLYYSYEPASRPLTSEWLSMYMGCEATAFGLGSRLIEEAPEQALAA